MLYRLFIAQTLLRDDKKLYDVFYHPDVTSLLL